MATDYQKPKLKILKILLFLFYLFLCTPGYAQRVVLESGDIGFMASGERMHLDNKALDLRENAMLFGNQNTIMDGITELNIASGAELHLAADRITLRGGIFNNQGIFDAGLSTVIFELLNLVSGQIKGNNAFHDLVIDSGKNAGAKDLILESNTTQSIKSSITFDSDDNNPLTIRSSGTGVARLDLQQGAFQKSGFPKVIVKDVHSIGREICVSPSSTLENATGFNPFCDGGGGPPGNGSAVFGNISYNGFVNEVIRPAFIQLETAQVVITAETQGLPDPQVSLKRISDSSTVASNDNCAEAGIAALIGRPLTTPSVDACIVQILPPGAYFFEVTGQGAKASGSVLAGVTQPLGSNAALQNISYNGFVSATGIRPAFIVFNTGQVVITAESLGLPNPQVALKRISDGNTVAFNDNCADANIANLIGRPLATAQDACIVVNSLAPDAYFIEVTDVGGGSGNALVGATQIIN